MTGDPRRAGIGGRLIWTPVGQVFVLNSKLKRKPQEGSWDIYFERRGSETGKGSTAFIRAAGDLL